MVDLIEKFFGSETTHDEDIALGEILVSSEEAAGRFAEMAEASYFACGMPEPMEPGGFLRALRSWLSRFYPVIMVILGVAVWYLLGHQAVPPSDLGKGASPMIPGRATVPSTVVVEKTQPRLSYTPITRKAVGEAVGDSPGTRPMEEPPVPGNRAGKALNNLKVVVRQDSPGSVTVRILGPGMNEVRRLYEGPLQAGQWAFRWDGILSDGRPASPGRYLIEVDKGFTRSTQEVVIR